MGVAIFVRVLVMNAMRGYPGDGAAFKSERAASGEKILHPFRSFVAAMREQAVVAHADSQAAGNPPHDDANDQRFPGEKEDRAEGAQMQGDHDCGYAPVY